MKCIGLIVNHGKPTAAAMARTVARIANRLGIELLASAETVSVAGGGQVCAVESFLGRAEAIMVLGGDGTMLNAAHQLRGNNVPLMGLNLGDLGYLTSVEATRIEEARSACTRGGSPSAGARRWQASSSGPTETASLPCWMR